MPGRSKEPRPPPTLPLYSRGDKMRYGEKRMKKEDTLCRRAVSAFTDLNVKLHDLEEAGLISSSDRDEFIRVTLRILYKAGCGYVLKEITGE